MLGNVFTRIDRSGEIVETIRDRERERQGLVQVDSSSLTFDSTPAELSRRNIQEDIDDVRTLQKLPRRIRDQLSPDEPA